MASTQRTILAIVVAAATVIGAGRYFAPRTTADNAAGTVTPAARYKGDGDRGAEAPKAAASAQQPQSDRPMQGTLVQDGPTKAQQGANIITPYNAPNQQNRPIYTPYNAPQQGARPEYKTQ